MSFRLQVDAGSVLDAAGSVEAVGARLDGAPGAAALREVAASLPGGALAAAAAAEAAEWGREMATLTAVLERYAARLQASVAAQRRLDGSAAAALRAAP